MTITKPTHRKGAGSMKNFVSMATLVLAVSLITFTQLGCQPAPDTNRAESTAAANSNSNAVVDTAAIESELLRIENDWPRVLREKDVAAVRSVEADDGIFVRPDGTIVDKAQDVKDMEEGALTAESWDMAEMKVKVLDKDAAVVSGMSVVKGGKYKMPDGKFIDISGDYRFMDTFARRDGRWQVVAGMAVKSAQPAAAASPAAKASPAATASPAAKATPAAKASPVMKASPTPTPMTKATP